MRDIMATPVPGCTGSATAGLRADAIHAGTALYATAPRPVKFGHDCSGRRNHGTRNSFSPQPCVVWLAGGVGRGRRPVGAGIMRHGRNVPTGPEGTRRGRNGGHGAAARDRKSTRLNSSHL